jgi:hypothetical protein
MGRRESAFFYAQLSVDKCVLQLLKINHYICLDTNQ